MNGHQEAVCGLMAENEALRAEIAYLRGDGVDPTRVDMADESADLRDLARRIVNLAKRHRCYSQARDFVHTISTGLHAMAGHEEMLRKVAETDADIARLREALEPFEHADEQDWSWLTSYLGWSAHGQFWRRVFSDLRRARTALAAGEKE